VTTVNTNATVGSVTWQADGRFTYDPRGHFDYLAVGESATDTFTYTVSDGRGGADTAQVIITITGVNDRPAAVADSAATDEEHAVSGNLLANDTDPESDELVVTGVDTSGTRVRSLGRRTAVSPNDP